MPYNISREGLAALLERYQYSVVTVALYGDDKKIYERFVKRNHSPERHRGHVVDDCYPEEKGDRMVRTASFEDFIAGMKSRGMDSFSVGGYRIPVDTTDFRAVDLEELLREIIQWRDKIPVIK